MIAPRVVTPSTTTVSGREGSSLEGLAESSSDWQAVNPASIMVASNHDVIGFVCFLIIGFVFFHPRDLCYKDSPITPNLQTFQNLFPVFERK